MDYGRLRAAALSHGEDEEAVTVDTRALIDKVLARYSGEWTTLRELIQNAADAQATTVKVKWETLPSTQVPLPSTLDRSQLLKHALQHHTLRRLVVSNNGQPFTKTDWGRLKRIAEGNPDETKIGAFGVGFYSVFADCEEPFISSGNEAMAFYWKGNALFTRKLQLSQEQSNGDTAFVLDYRNTTTPMPNLLSVSQFLATSLTFVALENIEFWIDDYRILSLQKKTSPSAEVTLSRDVDTQTKDRLMRVQTVNRASAQIDASYMSAVGWKPQTTVAKTNEIGSDMPSLRSFFSRLTAPAKANKVIKEEQAVQEVISEDITALSNSTIFLRVTTATIKTNVTASFSAELERATKKPPPKMAKLAILTSSYDETKASEKSSTSGAVSKVTDVFASVLPSKKPGGRIFIGFPTTQTTGAGMHISAPSVIPTVEREAIDLNARWVRSWNIEMLRAAGIMTRLAFANEMNELQLTLQRSAENPGSKVRAKDIAKHMPAALHVLKSFTFGDSTPSGQVSQIIEEAFWTCYRKPYIEIYSTQGVRPTTQVRIGSEELSKFVGGIPVVPPELKDLEFVKKVTDFDLLAHITVDDVRQELSKYPMNKDQLISFIQWAGKKAAQGELDPGSRDRLLDAAIATSSEHDSDRSSILTLGIITNYLDPKKVPAGLPIPPTTIPLEFTNKSSFNELQALGWEPLEVAPWLRFIIETGSRRGDEQDLTKSPKFAVQVLMVLSKGWDNLGQNSKNITVSLLQAHTVMPTKLGMRKPTESFFPSVKLFDDLPTIEGCSSLKEKFLAAIGVRKTLDLDTIFKRLLNPSPGEGTNRSKWSHVELIKYLASVRADIPNDDLRKLKDSRICPAEVAPHGSDMSKASAQLYKVSELFEPKDALRPLNVRILQWPGANGGYRPSSVEGKFLWTLGLRPHPSVPELVQMMASSDQSLRENAMKYFIASHVSNGYSAFDIGSSAQSFLPIEGNPKQLVSPTGCYTNAAASILGFSILKKDLHAHAQKFGVRENPPIMECVARLVNSPPQTHEAALPIFQYFASRQNDLPGSPLAKLREAPIVPVKRRRLPSVSSPPEKGNGSGNSIVTHISPRNCFLGSSSTYGDIFDFVDFGSQANAFLYSCGAKTEPTKLEIAQLAASEPARLLSVFQSTEKYLNLLRSLADNYQDLKRDKELWKKMKVSPFLLAFKEISTPKAEKLVDIEEDEAPIRHYQLAAPSQIIIIDDYIGYRLFKDNLICAPEEDSLEYFYQALGAQTLGSLVTEDLKIGPSNEKQDGALWLHKHILERSKIFIHEYSKHTHGSIKHDAKWLEQNLTIQIVRSVALRRTLRGRGQSHTEERSAASRQAASGQGWTLFVASKSSRPDMYQVGQAICQLILNRPSQQAYTFFEPFLKLDLRDLQSRGYNVDRILRAKAAEARIAEEERRRALEAEQESIKEREEQFRQQNQAAAAAAREQNRTPPPRMPGGFGSPDSPPEQPAPAPIPGRRPKSIFSSLSKRFGFDDPGDKEEHLQSFLDPPKEASESSKSAAQLPEGSRTTKNEGDSGKVTNPATIQQNLLNAVKSVRAHDSSTLFAPPTTTDVKEQATYCDSTPFQNLTLAAESSNGTRVFTTKTLSMDLTQFLTSNHSHINTFAGLLREVGDVYAIRSSAMHIFYDEAGGTIAFNSNGSIFCNLRYFVQLHAANIAKSGQQRAEATVWWWVVVAHELAHNIISLHNADHSYYTESFIQQYFPKMMLKASEMALAAKPLLPSRGANGSVGGGAGGNGGAPPPYVA
ncbi:putative HATPase domain protein [Pseudomassariella vexata]|uniref:Putative HATPase domain protein n=1 Tax=Pseudomassariella vexata TaxID=1141098 RepID=A0A1Y2EL27_9PEZI|nr:putative HATPase domain protein [Pseudomassariella vexata]ORY71565.1 putative HATPase domain protein [Pseudomassariella vexata]